jgi:hypothetical protein
MLNDPALAFDTKPADTTDHTTENLIDVSDALVTATIDLAVITAEREPNGAARVLARLIACRPITRDHLIEHIREECRLLGATLTVKGTCCKATYHLEGDKVPPDAMLYSGMAAAGLPLMLFALFHRSRFVPPTPGYGSEASAARRRLGIDQQRSRLRRDAREIVALLATAA